jgi:hypothetical protein
MLGGSYLGVTQLMAASTQPPHLKAIFPVVALFDLYTVSYHGGVFYDDLHQHWSEFTKILDTEAVAAPVDEDKDESLLKAAIEEHKSSRPLIDIFSSLPYRDSVDKKTGAQPFYEWHPAGYIEEINQSGVPMYLFCGWFDSFTRDGFLMYRNFTTPRKMVMGNWPHNPHDPSVAREMLRVGIAEILRWFDYWLKGIDNGIMNDPPIHYHVMKAPGDNEWRSAEQWPLPEAKPTKYYFHKGPSGSVESVNDGILSLVPPYQESGKDDSPVDYSTTTGTATRWDNAVGGDFNYPDMTENDKKGLTYTTAPLPEDFELTGFPVVHLWVSSTAADGDFFVYLEEVDAEGISHYVTEGTLRAAHRALHEPYYDNLDLPFHRSHEEDMVGMVPGEPVELVFDLQPISNVFNTGNRLRVTITCADKDNALTPEISPSPVVSVYRNTKQGSYLLLPVFGPETEIGAEKQAGAALSLFTILIIAVGVVVLVIVFTAYIRSRFRK